MYTALNIAAEIVRQYKSLGQPITSLKLQKIMYYAQMASLQKYDQALFPEDFHAWRHGPVLIEVYEPFRKYISQNIDPDDPLLTKNTVKIDPQSTMLIRDIVNLTIQLSAWDLVNKTKETEPWKNTYIYNTNKIISKNNILKNGTINL